MDLPRSFTILESGAARARAAQLAVDGRVSFVQGDASGYVADAPVGIVGTARTVR